MERKRLSLIRAIDVYCSDGGRSTSELSVHTWSPEVASLLGVPVKDCEQAYKNYGYEYHDEISYDDLASGATYRVTFDNLAADIGDLIGRGEVLRIKFLRRTDNVGEVEGRWVAMATGDVPARDISEYMTLDEAKGLTSSLISWVTSCLISQALLISAEFCSATRVTPPATS